MPRTMRVEYPGAVYHVMDRGDRREDIFVDDVDRQDFLKTLAAACQKTGWQESEESDLASRRKADPDKLAIAVRLRNETTLSIKWIAARMRIGSSKGAKSVLHRWVHGQADTRQNQRRSRKSMCAARIRIYGLTPFLDPTVATLAHLPSELWTQLRRSRAYLPGALASIHTASFM